ncbi:MAG TPA: phosphoglycerate kinase [Candidatus Paceibacterota bacterium]
MQQSENKSAEGIRPISGLGEAELKGKTVLVRCDFNVPLRSDGTVIDDLRIRKTIPTVAHLKKSGARIVLISHIENKDGFGLEPVAKYISDMYARDFGKLGKGFSFVPDFLGDESVQAVAGLEDGSIILFENLRAHEGEKKNDPAFAQKLFDTVKPDVYVNDAFAVSHRAHASVVALPALCSERCAGIQMMNEIEHVGLAFNPPHPFVFILGGAKFDSKLPLIKKFSSGEKAADSIVLGGALLNDVLKAKGYEVGKSLVSSGSVDVSDVMNNGNLIIPTDVIVATEADASKGIVKPISGIGSEDAIYDAGPSLVEELSEKIASAKFVVWNGPMGLYEKGFQEQTVAIAELVAAQAKRGTLKAILGGGDTTAAVAELGLDNDDNNRNMFISTGGGAMLEYLMDESLPGIEALK